MTPEQQRQYADKRELLRETIKLLSTHGPFRQFMAEIEDMREAAIRDACSFQVANNTNSVAMSLGEVRCYSQIKELVDEFISQKPLDTDGL